MRMLAASAVVEVLIARSIEVSEALQFVLYGVAVYQVHDHRQPHSVGIVD